MESKTWKISDLAPDARLPTGIRVIREIGGKQYTLGSGQTITHRYYMVECGCGRRFQTRGSSLVEGANFKVSNKGERRGTSRCSVCRLKQARENLK